MSDNSNLIKLFREKKYLQIINYIEHEINIEDRNSSILNLLATCRLLKLKPSKQDYENSLNDFRTSYIKEKNTPRAHEALLNFINLTLIFFHNEKNLNKKFDPKLFAESIKYFEESNNFFKNNEKLILAIIRVFRCIADTKKVISCFLKLIEKNYVNQSILSIFIFYNNYLNSLDQKHFLKYSKKLEKILPSFSTEGLVKIDYTMKGKINLAFLSSDLKSNHSVTYFLKSLLKHYNKKKYNISIYCNNDETKKDKTLSSIEALVDKIIYIKKLNDIDTLNIIRSNKTDIIVDLMGLSSDNRIALFKNRVAPIQISWCGYCGTTGLENMDFLIADKNLIFEKEKQYYSEKILYLDNIWNAHCGYNFEREHHQLPSIKNSYITFGSLNNFSKINENVIDVWSTILKEIKNSKLILKGSSGIDPSFILDKFKKNSVLSSIDFIEYDPIPLNHLKLYNDIDIALDTFPYNGVTTSFEALWMGVPVITMTGYNFNSRCGESILKNADLIELISKDETDYIKKVVNLSKSTSNLIEIRNKIYKEIIESPLFDTKKFSNSFFKTLENIYRK